jgi:fatty-acyl-CoA synthase
MMAVPLALPSFLERAATLFPEKEVRSWSEEGLGRAGWRAVRNRAWALASALSDFGLGPGNRVASLAWNHQRHLELYFAVPAAGQVLLTVNARLSPEQIVQILGHAEARVVFADQEFVPLVDEICTRLPALEGRVVLAGDGGAGWRRYEDLVAMGDPRFVPSVLDEEQATGLCYTSGTTGEPKGVLYSHRALVLHTLGICLPDGFDLGEADVILPAVPMFHANAWGLPYAAAMVGATLVLPGPRPDPGRLVELMASEKVSFAAGVPTVWMDVLERLRAQSRTLPEGLRIHSGGAPTPPALLEAYRTEQGVDVLTGWGMTELSPVGCVTHPRGEMQGWSHEELLPVRTSQGTPLPLVEARIVDDVGGPVPRDGVSVGELEVRGPWVTDGYFRRGADGSFRDGWLRTGDVATMDDRGYVRLVDRTKDLIRSGGEWISSVQLEHALMDHPDVSEAVVVAVPHPRLQERPCACVVLRPGADVDSASLLASLQGRFPKWWIPDEIVFLDALPRTATGKADKRALRLRLREEGPGSDTR